MKNSKLSHRFRDSAGLMEIDLRGLLQQNISFGLINSPTFSKSLYPLNNGSDLTIGIDSSNQFYRFVAGMSELKIQAAFMDVQSAALPNVNFEGAVAIGSEVTIKDTTLFKGKYAKKPVKLYVFAHQLSSVQFSDGTVHHFSRMALSEHLSNAQHSFRSFAFLRLVGKEATLKIYQQKNEYWLITESLIGTGIKTRIYELLF
jgi:hypothetical protein